MKEIDRAIVLNPNDAEGYARRGEFLVYTGHAKEAIAAYEIAKRLNPSMGSGRYEAVGWAYYLDGRYADAIEALEAALRTSPDNYYLHAGLAASYAQLGRAEEASRAAAATMHAWPFFKADRFVRHFFQGEPNRSLIIEGLRKAGLK